MNDQQIIRNLIIGNTFIIRDFFFIWCRPMLVYIGQYFCQYKPSPEKLIGEFYEFFSADDWHKLRIFSEQSKNGY